jgi:hypothetical protein
VFKLQARIEVKEINQPIEEALFQQVLIKILVLEKENMVLDK